MLLTTLKNWKGKTKRWKLLNFNFMCGVDKPDPNFLLLVSEPWGHFYSVFILKGKLIILKLKVTCELLTGLGGR